MSKINLGSMHRVAFYPDRVQFWFSEEPFMRELPISIVNVPKLKIMLGFGNFKQVKANNTVDIYERQEEVDA